MINSRVEILVGEYPDIYSLDLDETLPMGFNYEVSAIQNISKKSGGWSNTIELPATKNNDYIFSALFDVASDFSIFNPNKNTYVKVMADGDVVFSGVLKLEKYEDKKDVNQKGYHGVYKVNITENTIDLVSLMGESLINELDFSQFNHTYSKTDIEASWVGDYTLGYYYPLLYNNNKYYTIKDFVPATYNYNILDIMFRKFGYGWSGSLKNNKQFQHEIIPYSGDGLPKYLESEIRESLFHAGIDTPYDEIIGTVSTAYTDNQNFKGIEYIPPFDDDYTTGNFDYGSNYDVILKQYTSNISAVAKFHIEFDIDVSLYVEDYAVIGDKKIRPTGNNDAGDVGAFIYTPSLSVYVELRRNGNRVISSSYNVDMPIIDTDPSGAPVTTFLKTLNVNFDTFNINMGVGDVFDVVYTVSYNKNPIISVYTNPYANYETSNGAEVPVGVKIGINNDNRFKFYNIINTQEIPEFGNVDMSRFLPKMKMKDFFDDLIKRYNLYITTDIDNPNIFKLDSRDDFYDTETILDWDKKKDRSKKDIIEFLPDLQNKEVKFTYNKGSNFENTEYQERTGEVYGQHRFIFDNDFSKGVKEIKSIFSPTINRGNYNSTNDNFIVPNINTFSLVGNYNQNPKLLYAGGLKNLVNKNWVFKFNNNVDQEWKSVYPMALTVDDTDNPTIDLNWGKPIYTLTTYNQTKYTTNNQFNTYWYNYMEGISEGKLVIMNFYLDSYDISQIKRDFGAKIYVDGNYYNVNKIVQYNPLDTKSVSVELIYIKSGVKFTGIIGSDFNSVPFIGGSVAGNIKIESINSGNGGLVKPYTWTNGIDNVVNIKSMNTGEVDPTLTFGNRNKNDMGVILGGDDNSLDGKNALLLGTTGVTASGDGIIAIGTRNITIDNPDLIYLGDKASISKSTGNIVMGVDSSFINGASIINDNFTNLVSNYVSLKTDFNELYTNPSVGEGNDGEIIFKDNRTSTILYNRYRTTTPVIISSSDVTIGSGALDSSIIASRSSIIGVGTRNNGIYSSLNSSIDFAVGVSSISSSIDCIIGAQMGSDYILQSSINSSNSCIIHTDSTAENVSILASVKGEIFKSDNSAIIGGDVNILSISSNSNIIGGIYNTLNDYTRKSMIGSSENCVISKGDISTIIGSRLSTIESTGTFYSLHSTIIGSRDSNITTTGLGNAQWINGIYTSRNSDLIKTGTGKYKQNVIMGGEYNQILNVDNVETRNNIITGSKGSYISDAIESSIISSENCYINKPHDGIPYYIPNSMIQRSSIIASTNCEVKYGNNSVVIGSSNSVIGGNNNVLIGISEPYIQPSGSNQTIVDTLVYLKGIRFGSSRIRTIKEINIGNWNMDTTADKFVNHGLSATEYKTVTQIDVMIFPDTGTNIFPLQYINGSALDGGFNDINPTSIQLNRKTGGSFDSATFDGSGNRGTISFWYTPD